MFRFFTTDWLSADFLGDTNQEPVAEHVDDWTVVILHLTFLSFLLFFIVILISQ